MNVESWLSGLAVELRRQGLPDGQVAAIVVDVRAHLRDSANDPYRAFGTPEHYALAVAESLRGPASRDRSVGAVRLQA